MNLYYFIHTEIMFRLFLIVCIHGMAMSDFILLDGFFGKPTNESTDVFRNPSLYPYQYRNVDEEIVCILHNIVFYIFIY